MTSASHLENIKFSEMSRDEFQDVFARTLSPLFRDAGKRAFVKYDSDSATLFETRRRAPYLKTKNFGSVAVLHIVE
jgi:hypothetical protein